MRLRSQVIGALNLFHTDPNALGPAVTQIGQALADVATIGLTRKQQVSRRSKPDWHLLARLVTGVVRRPGWGRSGR